jgi:hypothetical protein
MDPHRHIQTGYPGLQCPLVIPLYFPFLLSHVPFRETPLFLKVVDDELKKSIAFGRNFEIMEGFDMKRE